MQNDPADIPRLLEYLDRYDMATGWRQKREDKWLKKISSIIGKTIRNWLSAENIKDSACSLRAFKRECVQEIPVFNGMHRFLSTLVKMEGYRIVVSNATMTGLGSMHVEGLADGLYVQTAGMTSTFDLQIQGPDNKVVGDGLSIGGSR